MGSYSIDIVESVKNDHKSRLGNKLGRFCISNKIPVSAVARKIGVTRQTVYNWFLGEYDPRPEHYLKIYAFIKNNHVK